MARRGKSPLPLPTVEEIRARLEAKWHAEAMAVPRETRQRFLDLMWGGMTLGAAAAECGIEFDAARTILALNIEDGPMRLRRETV